MSGSCSFWPAAFFLSFFFNNFDVCICFWLHWVFVAGQAFSSCDKRGVLFVVVGWFLAVVASLVAERGL